MLYHSFWENGQIRSCDHKAAIFNRRTNLIAPVEVSRISICIIWYLSYFESAEIPTPSMNKWEREIFIIDPMSKYWTLNRCHPNRISIFMSINILQWWPFSTAVTEVVYIHLGPKPCVIFGGSDLYHYVCWDHYQHTEQSGNTCRTCNNQYFFMMMMIMIHFNPPSFKVQISLYQITLSG